MLPTYQRSSNSSTNSLFNRRSFRAWEKCLILLVLVSFGFVCFGGLFFLPDDFGADKVLKVYRDFQKASPEMFIPAPPAAHGINNEEDPHLVFDRNKLAEKIKYELGDILEKPETGKKYDLDEGPMAVPPVPQLLSEPNDITTIPVFKIVHGEDSDPVAQSRRNKVKEMMKHAWDSYKLYAWGKNELRPLSRRPHAGSVFGAADLGATIVDGLDTLYIMGMMDEYQEGRDWVARRFTLDNVTTDMSVFETNIRFIGGFLTLYAFTGDSMYKDKAAYVADKMLPAFQTPTGIPNALVNVRTGNSKNYGWASGGSSILSEFGTLHLEFSYLSDITGNPVYKERVQTIRQILKDIEKPNGLYPNYLNPKTGKWGQQHMSLGALGDSFFEYLLKAWIQSGQTDSDARTMYDDAMQAIIEHMIRTSPGGLTYVSDMKFERLENKMDHLACFAGGLFGLGSVTDKDNAWSNKYMDIAKGLTNTCHESYDRTPTKLGPESFRFSDGAEAKALKSQEKYYILRPETFESYFVMWRLTHDEKYREWGWQGVQALESHCRTPNGYSGIKNVYQADPTLDDVQQSFFLAETLKYLYLLYSDDSLVSLDEWVFNTEAHPLPIKSNNTLYRMAVSPSSP